MHMFEVVVTVATEAAFDVSIVVGIADGNEDGNDAGCSCFLLLLLLLTAACHLPFDVCHCCCCSLLYLPSISSIGFRRFGFVDWFNAVALTVFGSM